jgi:serine/threonine protein kinase
MTIAAGTRFGHYEIISLLGAGGMGEVYLAQDTKLPRTIALKILTDKAALNPQDARRFVQEARIASALRHPNIAHIYEVGESNDTHFIAMEYVDGVTLRKRKLLKLSEVLEVASDVASALCVAHAVGIVHRDIKPENIMLSSNGYVKVLDFGLAKHILPELETNSDFEATTTPLVFTDPGSIVGTVLYMSPEQARGLPVDARTDLWSLGAVMYEMIAGRAPFEANTASDVVSQILREEPAPLARFSRQIPDSIEWLVMKALVKDREGRYQTSKEMLSDIERVRHRLAVEAESGRLSKEQTAGTSEERREIKRGSSDPHSIDSQFTHSLSRSSSLGYLVTEIKSHKKATAIAVSLLVPVIIVGVYLLLGVSRSSKSTSSSPRALSRLTFDAGLQTEPSWSPDGRFLAYESDRSGNFDIWVQPVGGGDPVQVTRSPAHDWQPDWSPDGNSIVFRSEREGGGLFIAPAFGGRERRLSSFGYRPRWSPDGSKVLCLSPGERVYEYPSVFLVSLDGTAPKEISTSVSEHESDAKQGLVAWHPDGQHISFLADDGGFWTTQIAGGKPVRAEVSSRVARQLKDAAVELGNFRWAPAGNAIYFEGNSAGVLNLWKITVDPKTLAWIDGPERLTTGLGPDTEISLSNDGKRLAFSTIAKSTRIWSLPFDPLSGKTKGNGQAITLSDDDAWSPDISPDGKQLVFVMRRHGKDREELFVKSLKDGATKSLAVDGYTRIIPRWSPDGRWVAYTRYLARTVESERQYPIMLLPTGGGEEQLLTTPGPFRDYLYDWSPDGQAVIGSTNRNSGDRYYLALFPLSAAPRAETSMRIIASDQDNDLWAPRFSPDGRWICYLAQKASNPGVSVLNVVSSSGGASAHITDEHLWSDKPRWSPDGKTIYFITNHGSMFLNVWGIRFDPAQAKALGEPFRVTSFESPGLVISIPIRQLEMTFDQTHLYLPVTEVSGSIWTLNDVDR